MVQLSSTIKEAHKRIVLCYGIIQGTIDDTCDKIQCLVIAVP